MHATPWDSKFLVYVGDNSQFDDECYTALDMWTAWSMLELMLGHWLDVDPWGRPFERFLVSKKREGEREREREREQSEA